MSEIKKKNPRFVSIIEGKHNFIYSSQKLYIVLIPNVDVESNVQFGLKLHEKLNFQKKKRNLNFYQISKIFWKKRT